MADGLKYLISSDLFEADVTLTSQLKHNKDKFQQSLKGTGKTSSGASNIHLKINFTKQTCAENWHRRDFSVSAPLEGEEGGPGGRRDDRHGAPQHVGHQGHQD